MFSLPALPSLSLGAAQTALPTAVAVPAHARSWAVYMSLLHGECRPQVLQNMLNIPAGDAKRYVAQLIAEGAIKPNPILQSVVSDYTKTDKNGLLEKLKERLEMKKQTQFEMNEVRDQPDDAESLDAEMQLSEDTCESDIEISKDDDVAQDEASSPDASEAQT